MSNLTAAAAREAANGITRQFVAADGTAYTVVYSPAGSPARLVGTNVEPTARFYDVTSGHKIADREDPYTDAADREHYRTIGQDTGGSYFVSTLLGEDTGSTLSAYATPLHLAWGQPFWQIDAATMAQVRLWLREVRASN